MEGAEHRITAKIFDDYRNNANKFGKYHNLKKVCIAVAREKREAKQAARLWKQRHNFYWFVNTQTVD